MSTEWWYWLRISPFALIPFGHEIIRGSDVPPEYSAYRLNIWNGVEKAAAHPVGKCS